MSDSSEERKFNNNNKNNNNNEEQQQSENDEEFKRKELPYLFEKELIENQNRHIRIMESYVATKKIPPLNEKSYSKFERKPTVSADGKLDLNDEDMKYFDFIENFNTEPRFKFDIPLLESHRYGWIPRSVDRKKTFEMNVIQAPKIRGNLTIFGESLFSGRVTQRPAFTGLRFVLK